MFENQPARRPILVSWVYNDGDDGSNAFVERILATPDEEARLRRRLITLTDPSVDSRTRSGPSTTSTSGPSSPSRHRSRTSGASWT